MGYLSTKQSDRFDVDYSVLPKTPREIFFDISSACNHKCFFCSNSEYSINLTINTSLVFRLLKEAAEIGVSNVALYATGEPFLHKDLAKMTKEAKRLNISYVFISTNGALATPKKARPVLEAGLDSIKFSVNGFNRENYFKVHGRDQFNRVLSNIKWFWDFRKFSGLKYKIFVSSVQSSKNKEDWNEMYRQFSPYVDEIVIRGVSNQGGNMYINNVTEEINENNLLGSLQNNQLDNLSKNKCCPDPFHRLTVTPEGYASVCVVDYNNNLTVADLNESTIMEAWGNEHFLNLRKRHLENNLDGTLCKNCLYNVDENYSPLIPEFSRKNK